VASQTRLVTGFVAYDCSNGTNRVDAYSLLEPAACPAHEDHHEVERTIFGEIVQMKNEWTVPVLCCIIIESVMSQYCGFNSAGVVVRYITFREPRRGDPLGGGVPPDVGAAVQGAHQDLLQLQQHPGRRPGPHGGQGQGAGGRLGLGTMFVLCGISALHTHIPNIAVFAHQDHRMEVATGRFKEQPARTDVTKLETTMSFL
jgi:hypothetical protein